MKPTVAVLVLFFNKLDQTIACVESFIPSGEPIYVLNNGSDPKDFQLLQQRFASFDQLRFLDAGKNLGPSGGRNLLIAASTEPWMFFVDNDITVKQSAWKEIFH